MKNIALFLSDYEKSRKAAHQAALFLDSKGCKVYLSSTCSIKGFNCLGYMSADEIQNNCDALISFGGDGTFLKAASQIMGSEVPLFGFNLGTLGFLAEDSIDLLEEIIDKIIKEDFYVRERLTLKCEVERLGEIVFSENALNEIAFHRSCDPRILSLSFYINEMYGGTYKADGIVLATPTGSTAYSLSAGGPIVNPEVACFLMTALCPHTLSARPLVLAPYDTVRIKEAEEKPIMITLDGHSNFMPKSHDIITAQKAEKGLRIISFKDDFYGIVREKLQWAIR